VILNRQRLSTLRTAILGLAVFVLYSPVDAFGKDTPNILWIVAEDISPWMPAFGDDTIETPTLDDMVESGLVLRSAFAAVPICSPSRSSLITGRYPTSDGTHNHRLSRDPLGRDAVRLPEWQKTLPEIFQEHGYKTFNIGKDDYNFVYDRRSLYSHGPDGIPGHIGEQKGPDFDWIELARSGPFFGQIQIKGGKSRQNISNPVPISAVEVAPYYPDTKLVREAYARHYDTIRITDREIADILQKLDKAGLTKSTIVFFISDHGMLLLRHKQFLYDGGIHAPVIISGPGYAERLKRYGTYRDQLVSFIDLAPTALDLAGIPVPDYMQGQSVVAETYVPRSSVVASRDRADYTFDRIRAIRTERFKYIRNYFPEVPYMQPQYRDKWPIAREYRALYQDGKLNEVQAAFMVETRPPEELYDLENDPHETINLAEDPRFDAEKARLSGMLDLWIEETGDKGQVEEIEEAIGAVVARWGADCVDRRCVEYRKNHDEESPTPEKALTKGQRREN
jgi:arylsulfatase A-like enzyme